MLISLALLLVQAPIQPRPQSLDQVAQAPRQALLRVPAGALSVEHVRELELDIAGTTRAGAIELLADDADRAALTQAGVPFVVVHEDLAAFYAARLQREAILGTPAHGAWLSPVFGAGSIGGYYSNAEVESVLDQIHAAYPNLTTSKFSIGTTIEGRDIWALKISDNPDVDENEPEVRFDAMHHAREPQSMQSTLWLMLALLEDYGSDPLATWLVNEREMWFLPIVNPDGYVHNESTDPGGGGLWRKNRRNNGGGSFGVDLNRNYAYEWGFDDDGSSPSSSSEVYRGTGPASEPEVAAMQAFIDGRDFQTVISAHTYSNLWLWPWGYIAAAPANAADYSELGDLCTLETNWTRGPAAVVLYLANGVTDDYDHGVHGTMIFTPEIGSSNDGFWPPTSRIIPLAEITEPGFLRTAWAAGAYVHATDFAGSELGDGNGLFEAGESFQVLVSVRNSGRAASGAVEVELECSTPGITITTALAALGPIGSFAGGDNAGQPLELAIGAGVTGGTRVDYVVKLRHDGLQQDLPGSFTVGAPRLFLADNLETDIGWTVGAPGDGASTGIWAHGNPVGTNSGGSPSNPEDDATPGSGTLCFVTGNGSTTAGGDDVDGGPTTLTSPRMDLSGVSGASVSLMRWFANFTTQNDALEIALSDDDGASWTTVETITGSSSNNWFQSTFDVQDHVALSDQVRLRFRTGDSPNDSLTEAGVDDIEVVTYDSRPKLNFYGTPAIGSEVVMHVAADPGSRWAVLGSTAPGATLLPSSLIGATRGTTLRLPGGVTPAGGLARVTISIPNNPALLGTQLSVRVVVLGETRKFSNLATLTFE